MSLCHAGDTTKRSEMNVTQAQLPVPVPVNWQSSTGISAHQLAGICILCLPPSKSIGAKGKPLILVGMIGNPETIENDTVIRAINIKIFQVTISTLRILLSRYFSSSSTQRCEIRHFVSRMMSVTVFSRQIQ